MRTIANIVILLIALSASFNTLAGRAAAKSDVAAGLLLVVNKGDRTLSIVDPKSGRQLAAVPVGGITGHEVAVSPNGRTAWVPIYGDSGVGSPGTDGRTISVIDLKSRTRVGSIDLRVPSRPHCPIFSTGDQRLYVTTELTRSITVIDPVSEKVIDSIPTGEPESHMMAISRDGRRAYTANVGAGTVSAIDLQTKKVLAVIPVAKSVQRIAISVDNRWVFTADQTKPELVVIDARTNIVEARVPLPDLGYGLTASHDGRRLFITHPSSDRISMLNLNSMKIERVIRVPAEPQEILVRPDDRVAYVSCDQSKQVAVIDLSAGRVEKLIPVGAGADGLAWAASAR